MAATAHTQKPKEERPRRDLRRPGPRPLALHLAMAGAASINSLSGLTASSAGSMPWSGSATAKGTAQALAGAEAAEPGALVEAVRAAATRRLAAFCDGLDAYRAHRFSRPPGDAAVVWRSGGARLLDYGRGGETHAALLVASLVNRSYILDLLPERSLTAHLAGRGIRPLLLDWGDLAGDETGFDLTDFVLHRLEPAARAARRIAGRRPLAAIGYCMGGNLALALALRHPAAIAGVALLATPWDFHAEAAAGARALAAFAEIMMPAFRALGVMPLDVLQGLFAGLDPLLAYRKFRRFAALDPDGEEARLFVALEDWLNDGTPLPWRVVEECLVGWYGANRPARGAWAVAGDSVRPEALAMPSLAIVPANDRIVPPASALALARSLPGGRILRASAGHIGMMAGGRARDEAWRPLADWIRALPAGAGEDGARRRRRP
jgi:polyhydroxyalkanoate synthase